MLTAERLPQLGLLGIDACTTLTASLESPLRLAQSVTAASVPGSKPTISKGRSNGCCQSMQEQKSSEISGPVLTSKEKACVPYWNEFCAETNSRLWLPTETALLDSDLTYSGSLSRATVENSWFNVKTSEPRKKRCVTTSLLSSTTSPVECTASEVTRTVKIRLYPTTEQELLFENWLQVSRYVYNRTVDAINTGMKSNWRAAYPFLARFFPADMRAVPFQIKKIACKDAYTGFFASIKKGSRFRLSYRTRKDHVQSCFIPQSAISASGIYYTLSGVLKMTEVIPANVRDSRLVHDHGRWFLACSHSKPTMQSDSQGRIVALDPGVRTFLTGYHEHGVFKFGSSAQTRIFRLCRHADKLIGRIAVTAKRRKANMGKALDRLTWKIRDLIADMHFKCANWLCRNFDIILLPTFEVSDMVLKSKRKIRSKTVRQMLTLAHYKFEQRIKVKAQEFGRLVLLVNEAYTSKTASWTGEVKQIGGAKKITSAGITLDRDVNGARGIYLRALVDTPWLRSYAACTRCN